MGAKDALLATKKQICAENLGKSPTGADRVT